MHTLPTDTSDVHKGDTDRTREKSTCKHAVHTTPDSTHRKQCTSDQQGHRTRDSNETLVAGSLTATEYGSRLLDPNFKSLFQQLINNTHTEQAHRTIAKASHA